MSTLVSSQTDPRAVTLRPMLSPRFALRWSHVLLTAWLAMFFLYLNYMPLYHTDIWGHVHWGQWILEHGQLPTEDPYMPLAAGVSEINNAWLSQLLFALAEHWGGDEGLSHLYAVVVLTSFAVLLRVFYLQSGRLSLAFAGMSGVLATIWARNAIIRPEIFGGLCFALLLWLLVYVEPWRRGASVVRAHARGRTSLGAWHWVALFTLFAAWANLHGSFAVGLVILAALAVGTCLHAVAKSRGLLAVFTDRDALQSILRLEVAGVATLCNPHGIDLLLATVRFGGNPNLNEVLEWYPLRMIDLEGIAFTITLLLVMVGLRLSRRRIQAAEVLIFLSLATLTAVRVRMINWYVPAAFFLAMPHLASAWRWKFGQRRRAVVAPEELNARHFVPTLACGLIVWIAFSLAPVSKPLLGGETRAPRQLYSHATPVGVTNFLQEKNVTGLILSPQWWGDWIAMHGAEGSSVFMTTHIHLAPRRVWTDYLTVARGQAGWQRILDKYNVETLVVHKQLQTNLSQQSRGSGEWRTVYEDSMAIVLQRVK